MIFSLKFHRHEELKQSFNLGDISSLSGLALASGLAATVTITHLLKAGDGIVCMDDVYGGETAAFNSSPCHPGCLD